MDAALQAEFRRGFYRGRPSGWIERIADECGQVASDVVGHLTALAAGQCDFAYPRDDERCSVLQLLMARGGADVGWLN